MSMADIHKKAKADPDSGVFFKPPNDWKGPLVFYKMATIGVTNGTNWYRSLWKVGAGNPRKGETVQIFNNWSAERAFTVPMFIDFWTSLGITEKRVYKLVDSKNADEWTAALSGKSTIGVAAWDSKGATDKNGDVYVNWTAHSRKNSTREGDIDDLSEVEFDAYEDDEPRKKGKKGKKGKKAAPAEPAPKAKKKKAKKAKPVEEVWDDDLEF